jgi:hypothetical protein
MWLKEPNLKNKSEKMIMLSKQPFYKKEYSNPQYGRWEKTISKSHKSLNG